MLVQFATIADVWEWAALSRAHALTHTRREYRCLIAQTGISDAFALRDTPEGAPLVIAGIVDLVPGQGELWFLGPPAGRGGLGRRLVRVVRLAADWLDRWQARTGSGLVCHIAAGHADGQRLARMLGFLPAGVEAGLETWRR